jgi:2-polyprenyl-3-methyl-5-hydroxy-6-metoxy-1,4-benzoquinol methylase
MLSGKGNVLEVGCGDGSGARVVLQEVGAVTAVDFDPVFIEDAKSHATDRWPVDFRVHDILSGALTTSDGAPFAAAYSMDVIEHITPENEDLFFANICKSLTPDGVLIIGSPSLESQVHASPPSKAGHVNCKSGPQLKRLCERNFSNVFLFSMNDEVVHTGYSPMAHYLIALCAGVRTK